MITQIGIAAGEIWHYLDKHESASLDQLASGIDKPKELILMSLGWLAREGHVTLSRDKKGYIARLNPSPKSEPES